MSKKSGGVFMYKKRDCPLVPTSQILFGSDYPYVPIGITAIGMTNAGLSAAEQQTIGRDNATRLLPRLKA
jgi:predicted TIM-barrel fold metal-dependent hydrolase